jgi:Subtilase family
MKACKTTTTPHGFGGKLRRARRLALALFILPCLLALPTLSKAQSDSIIVVFQPNVTQGYIDSLLDALNGVELGFTTPSQCRLWRITCTPGNPCFINGIPITDINEVPGQIVNKPEIQGGGMNHLMLSPNTPTNTLPPPALPLSLQNFVGCNSAPIVITGSPDPKAVIALIDSGVGPHNYFTPNFFHPDSHSFTGGNPNVDLNGHGTFIAGILRTMDAMGGNNNMQVMNLQIVGANGQSSVWSLIQAVDWATTHQADIMNISLGYPRDSLILPAFNHWQLPS